jgi:hypothetical protein
MPMRLFTSAVNPIHVTAAHPIHVATANPYPSSSY